eukprot:Amastigsp_a844514_142.p4 type:complete len:164 gc:universal Amastigsp_a844514_142:512-21(-)
MRSCHSGCAARICWLWFIGAMHGPHQRAKKSRRSTWPTSWPSASLPWVSKSMILGVLGMGVPGRRPISESSMNSSNRFRAAATNLSRAPSSLAAILPLRTTPASIAGIESAVPRTCCITMTSTETWRAHSASRSWPSTQSMKSLRCCAVKSSHPEDSAAAMFE